MLFEAFTGSFLGVPGMRERIDTRLLTDNVFYREKTFLRQLFFRWGVARSCERAERRLALTFEKRFRFSGSCARECLS
ncbi:MAG: hypothetical protein ABJB10_12550, partial [Mesorhizobium sp.]